MLTVVPTSGALSMLRLPPARRVLDLMFVSPRPAPFCWTSSKLKPLPFIFYDCFAILHLCNKVKMSISVAFACFIIFWNTFLDNTERASTFSVVSFPFARLPN